jgi:lysozyme
MASLESDRLRALKIYADKADKSVPMLLDYHIDDFLRELLELPARPDGQLPYAGWLTTKSGNPVKFSKVSQAGVDLIKRWEGLRTNAYKCPAGVWTIGYGHTRTAKPGMMISHGEAENLLREDLKGFELAVSRAVTVPLNQNQFDALVSFAFNVGIGAFVKSSLLRILNTGDYEDAARQFSRWVRGGGQKLPGLVSRRKAEYELFVK